MTEHHHGQEVLRELAPQGRALRQMIPDVYEGYNAFHAAAFQPGALDRRQKELVALAVAVALRCDGCIAAHARSAASHGATREEVAEAIGVSMLMTGGPGTVYGPRAFDAFVEFEEQRAERDAKGPA
jgi:AhpD family alkylhydroperoxidase